MERKHLLADLTTFHSRVYESIRKGEKITIWCEASIDVKGLTIGISQGIERKRLERTVEYFADEAKLDLAVYKVQQSDRVGACFAECSNNQELEDVETHWPRYQATLFTSTVTVSVDYREPINRAFVSQCTRTGNSRETIQMEGRARNNISGEVVILFCPSKSSCCTARP